VDESAGVSVTRYLREQGYDVLAVGELTPRARDNDILNWAVAEERIIVTNDKDFGELVYRSGQRHSGVLLFRLRDEASANKVSVLASALTLYSEKLSGRFTVLSEERVRIRWQPQDTSDPRGQS
jgi:predicted nuclease of predicted toxin-antitoxin system